MSNAFYDKDSFPGVYTIYIMQILLSWPLGGRGGFDGWRENGNEVTGGKKKDGEGKKGENCIKMR